MAAIQSSSGLKASFEISYFAALCGFDDLSGVTCGAMGELPLAVSQFVAVVIGSRYVL